MPAQRNELNPQPVEFVEFGVDHQLGIENQFFRVPADTFLPEPDAVEDLVVLLIFTQFSRWCSKRRVRLGILHQERQDALLLPTSLGHVVLLDQSILTMEAVRLSDSHFLRVFAARPPSSGACRG